MTESTAAFYRFTDGVLTNAPNAVYALDYTILASEHENYTYPVGGWWWFDTIKEAEAHFGLNGRTNARWQEFAAALVLHPEVGPMVEAFLDTLAVNKKTLQGMVYVGLGQAAQGDGQTFSNAWILATMQGFISPELAAAVAALAVHYDLPAEFVAALNPQAGV